MDACLPFFSGLVASGFFVDALDDALLDSFVDGELMVAPAHGVAVEKDVADELVEVTIGPTMGGHDGDGAAPGGYREGDFEQGALVRVKCELIDFDVAAFAGQGVGVGGEAVDAAA